ncbi:MAG: hypothetical protein ACK4E3_03285 [Brevundimonas sp.]|uniref:hypothetical protein n=1 Tax=Brevundimonas sp. TaxID=1871086 RepID=UPI00391A31AF
MGYLTHADGLPTDFPTHMHSAEFWEQLGRAVATFGFLEEVLGKAIFALTATRRYEEDEIDEAYLKWIPTLERAASDTLGGLIGLYDESLNDNPDVRFTNASDLIADLRKAARLRNVLCHGSWGVPSDDGSSLPFFIDNKEMMIFDTRIDVDHLVQTRKHVVELCCSVINSVMHMGWQFPGSSGPGQEILRPSGGSH